MKLFKTLATILIVGFMTYSYADESIKLEKFDETKNLSYPIDPRPFLRETDSLARIFFNENPNYLKTAKLGKTAHNFQVGDTRSWYTSDMENGGFVSVASTCRAVGEHCYIFVEDAIWNDRISQNGVDSVRIAFDSKTPADPNKGIFEIDVETFGNPPDIDGDPKIIIFILDILDGYDGSGGYVAGYFHSWNETSGSGSNQAEIYYLDADPADLTSAYGLQNGMSTTAHEFQHMIHYNYDQNEVTFVNEGLSLIAEVVNGFAMREQYLYLSNTNIDLFNWSYDNALPDYSRAALFTLYLYEQVGGDVLKQIVQNTNTGISGYNTGIGNTTPATTLSFNDILDNWFLANIVADRSVNPAWGYKYPNLQEVVGIKHTDPNVDNNTLSVENMSAEYLRYELGSNLNILFEEDKSNFYVKAITVDTNDVKEVTDITSNSTTSFPEYGNKYKEIDFAIINKNQLSIMSVDYSSTGDAPPSVELKYDNYAPTGVLPLSDNDTICVVFDDVSMKKLDSISVALRQPGTITGGIYKYTGDTRPTPLGEKLTDLTITSTISEKPAYPYPEPWPNWITIDLSDKSIPASDPFVIALLVEGTYPENNRVMITEQPGQSAYHSYTYLNDPGSGAPDWYYISASDTSVYVYLMRAYLSEGALTPVIDEFTTNTNEILLGEKVTLSWNINNCDSISINGVSDTNSIGSMDFYPKADTAYTLTAYNEDGSITSNSISVKVNVVFNLSQNYPNPFNATTTIPFDIENDANVKLVIYNILGQKVKTVVDRDCNAGHYDIIWHATNDMGNVVPSGIYIYKIESDKNSNVKKLLFLK
ncbi:MAG: T9SS type A sorting domain-containing protein [Candidatus Marinimicrobia bacterium]|nr:T9SS type A sorting domain-containing protein [Candidatus Neomarinimicrobiota bacterium]